MLGFGLGIGFELGLVSQDGSQHWSQFGSVKMHYKCDNSTPGMC